MSTTTPAQIRDTLTEQQRALLAKLDDLSPQQLHDALCYLIGGAPDLTGRALDGCRSQNAATEIRTRESHCSCGRPAREVLDGGEHGPTGYCGVPGMPPLDECTCGHWSRHDRSVCHIYGAGGSS